MTDQALKAEISVNSSGQRLDQALAELFPDYSRSRIQQWIRKGNVSVNDKIIKRPREKVYGSEIVEMTVEAEVEVSWTAENLPVDIVAGPSFPYRLE